LVAGRVIEPGDRERRVTVISARLAAKVWPGQNPLGKKFKTGSNVGEVEVVGVVRDTYNGRLDESPTLIVYVPYWVRAPGYGSLVVRSAGDPAQVMRAVQRTIWSIDSRMPVSEVRTMSEIVSEALAQREFQMRLAAAFGIGALTLAVIGIYGAVAYNVAQRRGELGLRMALGAKGSELITLVLRRGLWPVCAGLVCGLVLSLGLGGFVRGLLFGVTVGDPLNMGAVVLLLGVTAVVACWVPASRAARMDPASVLRCE
jgi:ABC-type antimicrobial peptide transport system permease subunit